MIVTTIETVPGREIIEHLGLVQGNTVRAKHVGRDIMAGLKNIVGGRLNSYETLIDRARREAIVRMQKDAESLGADAIYNARFKFSKVGQQPQHAGGAELLANGTAVRYEGSYES